MSNYTKSLKPLKKKLFKKWLYEKYPQYMTFVDEIFTFMEEKNSLTWFEDNATLQKENSVYQNIANFRKHKIIAELPVENEQLLNAYMTDFASTLDFRNRFLDFDLEILRNLAQNSNIIFNMKGGWRAYNFLFATIHEYSLGQTSYNVDFDAYFKTTIGFENELPPDFESMSDEKIILLDFPVYDVFTDQANDYQIGRSLKMELQINEVLTFTIGDEITDGTSSATGIVVQIDAGNDYLYLDKCIKTFGVSNTVTSPSGGSGTIVSVSSSLTVADIGTKPYEYEIVSKNDIIAIGDFSKKLNSNFTPSGFNSNMKFKLDNISFETLVSTNATIKEIYELDSISLKIWILVTGLWNDINIWIDSEVWID